ncbi:MAG: hypothetical protein J0M20_01115 [Burkholderiales bacterium]|nr:hypothetical protein [Burkholderiales bacterium]
MTTKAGYAKDVKERLWVVPDANLTRLWAMCRLFVSVGWIMIRLRPAFVVTTGAAPGLAAVIWGRLLGARTVWIDSIANAEELSGSGVHARRFAHVWLTQWEHLAKPGGPAFWGSVL